MDMRKSLLILLFVASCVFGSNVTAYGQSPLFKLLAKPPASGGCDADAQTFIGVVDIGGADAAAICELVKDLKDSSLWSAMTAIYPMIGGTADKHKYNLKDPQDLDASFRLNFQGTWTHNSSGADPNGSNAYADTYVNLSTTLGNYDRHWSFYGTENSTNDGWFGVYSTLIFGFEVYGAGVMAVGLNSLAGTGVSNNPNEGFYTGTVNSSATSNTFLYKNGALVYTSSAASFTPNLTFYLGALNQSGATLYSNRNIAFASLGAKLTADQARALNNIVEEYQDALGRGVQ